MADESADRSESSVVVELSPVSSVSEIRENVRRFDRDLASFRERAISLVRQTSYWVADLDNGHFGPSKFVGYRSMTFRQYEAALAGQSSGARFDGSITRTAIEGALGPYEASQPLNDALQNWCSQHLGRDVFQGIDTSKWKFVQLAADRNYWAFACRPDRFAGLEAVAVLSEMEWTIDRSDPQPGDRLLIWQTKGNSDRRGVIALGEVIEGRRPATCPAEELKFWREAEPGLTDRIRLRVIPLPGLPIWEENAPELLGALAVARARGGTVFSLLPEQWHQLFRMAHGAPQELEDTARSRSRGQGFSLTPEARRAVELHAQSMAEEHFLKLGYFVKDVSKRCSYDLHCEKDSEELRVEVKGTTGAGESVFLTRNEVQHAREYSDRIALVIVRDIQLDATSGTPVALDGKMHVYLPWNIDHGTLSPMQYEYRLGTSDQQNKLS